MRKEEIFIIIPAYNEEEHIEKVIRDVKKFHDKIIVVDDGSTDSTVNIIKKTGVTLVKHLVNLGKGAALKTGYEMVFNMGGNFGIMIDADGQHDGADLPKFFDAIGKGNEIVLGYRNFNDNDPWVRKMVNNLARYLVFFLFNKKVKDLTCGFRALSKNAYNKICWESSSYGVETEMIVKIAKKDLDFTEIPVNSQYLDNYKGVTLFDAISILISVLKWRLI